MPGADVRQSTFAGGEIAPTLYGRTDLAKYHNSLRRCRNAFVSQHGAALNRPGTRYVAEVKDSTKKARLLPFIFNNDQTFVLEFGDQYIRFYTNGGQVVKDGAPYEVTTPYAHTDLARLKFAQIGDIITLVHPSYAPRELKRSSNTSWALSTLSITRSTGPTGLAFTYPRTDPQYSDVDHDGSRIYQGGYSINARDVLGDWYVWRSLQDNNRGNSPADPTATGWWSKEGKVPSELAGPTLNHLDTPNRPAKAWQWAVAAVDANGIESLPSAALKPDVDTANYNNSNRVSLATDRMVYLSWGAVAGAKYYNVYRGRDGLFGLIGSATGTAYTDDGNAPDYQTTPPVGNNPFSGAGDYPAVVAYFQQRRWFGATNNNPQTIWGSKTGDYSNFDLSQTVPKDEDSVEFTLASQQAEGIRSLRGLRVLLTLTQGGEWALQGGGGADSPITPSSVAAKPSSNRGASYLDPLPVGNVALYVQGLGNIVRELLYNLYSDSFDGNDLTVMAPHLFQGHKIVDWTFAPVPWSILWSVREDGILLGSTYLREHELCAWHWHDTGHRTGADATHDVFENICSVPEGSEHAVYVVVRRKINEAWKRYIERFVSRRIPFTATGDGTVGDAAYNPTPDPRQCVFLDAALTFNGAKATHFSGLDHLEGCEVGVLADANVMHRYVVRGGAIDLSEEWPEGASIVTVGLPYTSQIETLDLVLPNQEVRSNKKNVYRVSLEVVDSRGIKVGAAADKLDELPPEAVIPWIHGRTGGTGWGPVALVTGLAHVRIRSTYEHGGRVFIQQDDPLPLTIVGLGREVDIGGS